MESERALSRPLVECVPNFSEGRDPVIVEALVAAISEVRGAFVLDHTSDPDHHRTVITFAGAPEPVLKAAVRVAGKAAQLIDLNHHRGVHPRLGALDVLPFVPLSGSTLADCAALAHRAGEQIWNEYGVPVYFYEAAALKPERRNLADVRRGEFEALRDLALTNPASAPDIGGPGLHPTAGAAIVGARPFLIAFNVDLRTSDVAIAKAIASKIRERDGGFRSVKALGLELPSRGLVQVSTNIVDFADTPPHVVFQEVSRLAASYGVEVERSELVGLAPRRAVEIAFAELLKIPKFDSLSIVENRLEDLMRSGDELDSASS